MKTLKKNPTYNNVRNGAFILKFHKGNRVCDVSGDGSNNSRLFVWADQSADHRSIRMSFQNKKSSARPVVGPNEPSEAEMKRARPCREFSDAAAPSVNHQSEAEGAEPAAAGPLGPS